MLTLSETMRHGYAMAEKYSKAAWRQGVKEGRAKGRAAVETRIAALKQKLQERQEVKAEVGAGVRCLRRKGSGSPLSALRPASPAFRALLPFSNVNRRLVHRNSEPALQGQRIEEHQEAGQNVRQKF